jgi:glycine/D-amino acid oxidase-like deaminating enzyme
MHSLKLWEGLEQDINYNAMVSQRGVLNLYHSDAQRDAYAQARQCDAARMVSTPNCSTATACAPWRRYLNFDTARFPIQGGLLQARGGTGARHDAVAWGYARAADRARRRHHPELRGHGLRARRGRAVTGVETTRGRIRPRRSRSRSPATPRASPRWRICACRSRAMCCRPSFRRALKPMIDTASSPMAPPISTSASPTRAGSSSAATSTATIQLCPARQPAVVEDVMRSRAMALWPGRARCACCGSWGGIMDMSMDGSPIIDHTPSTGLYLNAAGAMAASRRPRPRAGASRI